MHISEGVLSGAVLIAGAGLSTVGVGIGIKNLDYDQIPKVGLLSAVFFVASLVHIPVGPASAHLVLSGLCGLLLGWTAFPAILVGLSFQALLFQFGGLTTLGANTFNIAFPAVLLGMTLGKLVNSGNSAIRMTAEFLCGAGSIFFSGLLVALSLFATGKAFLPASKLIILAHIPIMLIEGLITVFIVEFVKKVRPEILSPA
ncbi:MAG: cobalt transporter CbiM [Desulfomonilaceae bacterium]|jgi:cobalt/nickel transport system permease protein